MFLLDEAHCIIKSALVTVGLSNWSVADWIRDTFKRGKYQDVILPLTVLRRIDCVLAPAKEKVLAANAKFRGMLENVEPQLRKASRFAFYNTSRYDFEKILSDAPNPAAILRNYTNGFSPNMREVIEKFDFDNTTTKLEYMKDSGYKVCGQENVISADFLRGERFVDEDKFNELKACEVVPGDILVTMMGSSGRSAVVPKGIVRG